MNATNEQIKAAYFAQNCDEVYLNQVLKQMMDWADQMEAEGPTGKFFATEVRNRLAIAMDVNLDR